MRFFSHRLSTPIVLALASAMVAVGLISIFSREYRAPERGPNVALVRDRTAVEAAESFLDAWRKRDHRSARRLSIGLAREEALAREAEDAALSAEEQQAKEQVWDRLAATRLTFVVEREAPTEDGAGAMLAGVASGEFMNRPYAREVAFVVRKTSRGRWRVEQMSLGDHRSEAPDFLVGD